jgi:hypothetical protein
MKRMSSLAVVALAALAGCLFDDDEPPMQSLRLTAARTEGGGCTTTEPLVLVITDLNGAMPTAEHEGEGATGPMGRHDPGPATCTRTIEDDGEWQTSCTFVPGSGADAFVEHIRITTDLRGGQIQPYLGVPPCADVYEITNITPLSSQADQRGG